MGFILWQYFDCTLLDFHCTPIVPEPIPPNTVYRTSVSP